MLDYFLRTHAHFLALTKDIKHFLFDSFQSLFPNKLLIGPGDKTAFANDRINQFLFLQLFIDTFGCNYTNLQILRKLPYGGKTLSRNQLPA
jgi:hypothetical protein